MLFACITKQHYENAYTWEVSSIKSISEWWMKNGICIVIKYMKLNMTLRKLNMWMMDGRL
jgi:hypothetical protein